MSAIISDCGKYRYRLERGAGRTLSVIMVNPSTANAMQDDPTIRKVLGFAERLFCERIIVGNKFAFRATDVNELRAAKDPVGPDNDHHIEQILRDGDLHVAAWGALSKLPETLAGALERDRADCRSCRLSAPLHRPQCRQAPQAPADDCIRHHHDSVGGAMVRGETNSPARSPAR